MNPYNPQRNAMTPRWEHFDHDADIGIRGIAPTLAEAFEQAAIALTAVVTDPERVMVSETIPIHC
ncbi:MAG: archease, partial [Methylosarcina sp.]